MSERERESVCVCMMERVCVCVRECVCVGDREGRRGEWGEGIQHTIVHAFPFFTCVHTRTIYV